MHRSPRRRATGLLLAAGTTAAATLGVVGLEPAGATTPRGIAFVTQDTLVVLTSNGADSVALRLAPGSTATLQVDFGDDGSAEVSVDRARFDEVFVGLGNGDDRFRVDQVNGAFADEAITVDGSRGNDTLNGGDGVERLLGGPGNDFADGNKGADTGLMGIGADVFRWDPGDGSDIVEGQNGFDTLDFRGAPIAENMQLIPNGDRAKLLRDAGTITMDLDGIERVDVLALGGADTYTVADMSGTDVRHTLVDLGADDKAKDTVTVRGTAAADDVDVAARNGRVEVRGLRPSVDITGSEVDDVLAITTLAGDDTVDLGVGVSGRITPTVDLGTDEP